MAQTCSMCGRARESEELLGTACGRCEKIAGDVDAKMVDVSGFDTP